MKKLTFLATTVASAALSLSAFGTTIQFGAATSTTARQTVLNDGSTIVPVGSLVWAGVFSSLGSFTYNPALTVLANVNNMVSLGGFQAFGFAPGGYNSSNGLWTTESSAYSLGIASSFGKNQVANSVTENTTVGGDASFFDTKQIYLVLFNGTTVSGSNQMGIFTSTAWTFPTNNNGVGDISSVYVTSTGTTVTAASPNSVPVGSVTSSPNQLVLAPSPEPSALVALLGGGGLLAIMRRRRTA